MPDLILRSPAKINLGLWVGKKRADGYHEIITIIVPLEFHDRIAIRTTRAGIEVTTDSKDVPPGPANLAYQAAEQFFRAAQIPAGCRIRISKSIPVGAGLGGGSSNAATVLLGLNRLFDQPLSARRLHQISLNLGSDVPAFLRQKPCVAHGRGEKLRPIRLPGLSILLYLPGYPVDTTWAYERLDRHRSANQTLTSPRLSPKILAARLRRKEPERSKACRKAQLTSTAVQVQNSFEPVVFGRHPDLAKMKRLLLENGCYAAALSGSGSTVYGLMEQNGSKDPMAALARLGFTCVRTRSI